MTKFCIVEAKVKTVLKNISYIVKSAKFSISIFIVMLMFAFVGYQIMKINLLKNAQNFGDNLARTYSLEQQSNFQFYSVLLSFGVSIVDNSEPQEVREKIMYFFRQVENLLGDKTIDPYLVDRNKVVALNPWDGDASYDFSNAVWYRQAEAHPGEVIFTDAYMDAIYHKPVITIAQKCASGPVLAFDIFPENIRFSSVLPDKDKSISFFLCDKQGTLLYSQTALSYSDAVVRSYVKDLFQRIKKNELAGYSTSIVDMDGHRRGVYYYEMPNGWISVLTIPFRLILRDLNSFVWLFWSLVVLLVAGMAMLTWRNICNQRRIDRTNEAVQVLGNRYYAIYRVDYGQERYEVIKCSDSTGSRLARTGPYADLLKVICEDLQDDYIQEYLEKFTLSNIRKLVTQHVREFGGDFRQRIGNACRWVSVRALHDEGLDSREVIICFREIEKEKQKQLEEHTLLVNSLNKAVQSDRAKQLFFSNISHEMRTPLNAVINLTKAAKRMEHAPSKIAEYLDKIERASSHLLQLVNDILEMSRLAQGKAELNLQRMDLHDYLEECFSPFRIQADMEGKTFRTTWNVEHTLVMGDAFRLTRIFNNLLSNALKFTDKGDSISVDISQVNQHEYAQYKIVVADTGIGMSEEFLSKIFEPYSRDPRVSSRPVTGTGLGMPLMKSMVELLNGSVVVSSTPGKGTAFTLILPFLTVHDNESPDPAEEGTHGENDSEIENYLHGKRVLVAEDNEINMEVATELLSMMGLVVEQAGNGREALDRFRHSAPFHFDAVLMDMQMPEMNGCEAGMNIRALPRPDARMVPVIAVTANAFAEDIAETVRAGMSAHVSKPIDFEKLRVLLEKLIRDYRAHQTPEQSPS